MANKKNIMTRYFFVILLFALIGIAIIVKAGFVMFGERQYWQDVADRFVKENVVVKPNRGNVLSDDGSLLASSLPEYRIYMDFKAGGIEKDTTLMNHLGEICAGLHKIFPDKSTAEFKNHILKGRKQGSRNYLLYPGRISYIQYKEAKMLPVLSLSKFRGGFHEQVYNQRKKPFGSLAARTLGDVYADTAQGARNGIELAFDSILKGREGITRRQKVKNKYLNLVELPPIDGCDVISTIDVTMQDICEKALVDKMEEINAQEGCVVLMEVKTGEVRAIVNMTKGRDGKYREERNGAISNLMEPGSTFKTASIMVALEDGYIKPTDVVSTGNGQMKMYGRTMKDHNWHRGGYGDIDVTKIMMVSSNVGVSSLIDKYYAKNPQKYVDGLYRMGLNKPLNLQIPGEGKPNIKTTKDKYWSKTSLPWMSIGYETQIPPINLLAFYNAIANDGKMIKPKFVKSVVKDGTIIKEYPTEVLVSSICSAGTLQQIRTMLEAVVSKGLAKPAGSSQFPVAGKTGTAQISQGAAGYKSGTTQYLVSFCGYFPADKPEFSCIVSIQKPGLPASGGTMAGSVFGKIAERVMAKNIVRDIKSAIDSTSIFIPDVKNGELSATKRVLDELDIKSKSNVSIRRNHLLWGSANSLSKAVELQPQSDVEKNKMPNVIGMGAKDALYILESKGLKVRLAGMGKVYRQSVPKDAHVAPGQTVSIELKIEN